MIQTINSTMKIQFRHTRVFTFLLTLLLLCGVASETWAYKVTYHILTLPIHQVEGENFRYNYHLNSSFEGKRLEAVRVVVDKVTTLPELPDAYKSPLVTENSFKYYASNNVTKSGTAVAMYDLYTAANKCYHYTINDEGNTVSVGTALTGDTDIYVTYEYDEDNTIADLSGNTEYNLTMSGGFLAFNRGRNNRIAVFQEKLNLVNNNALVSEDFVQFEYTNDNKIPGTNITTWWNQNPSPRASVAGQFHFIFKLEGKDPYNIIIGSTYDRDYTYVEMHGSEKYNRYKWYKGSYLYMPPGEKSGFFLASDDHKEYITKSTGYRADPVVMTSSDYNATTGYFRSKGADRTYNSFAILNNSTSNGYVFMLSRFINNSGDIDNPSNNKYNFLIRDGNYNNLTYASKTLAEATKDYSTDQKIYRVKNYVFKVRKKISGGDLPVTTRISEYYLGEDPRNLVPEELKRKYATFTGAYNNEDHDIQFATLAEVDASADPETIDGKTYKVIWLDYDDSSMPFKTSAPGTTYDNLKWYNFHVNKNLRNSAYWDGTKIKTSMDLSKYSRKSHYAFIGDPYDLQIVCRKATDDASGTFQYMKLASPTITDPAGFDGSGTTWGIVYDDDIADNKDCFRLKDFTSGNYLHQDTSTDNPLNGTATLGDAVRITVDNLPTKNYIYYIMRDDKTIAVMSQGRHEPSAKLSFSHIPAPISSPFIKDVPLQFYGGYTASEKGEFTSGEERAIAEAGAGTPSITYAPEIENGDTQYIVVRYTFNDTTSPTNYSKINGNTVTATFNVRLNGQYIYYDKNEEVEANRIKSSATIESNASRVYNWTLGGGDPYAMNIKPYSVNKYIAIREKEITPEVYDIDWPHGDEERVGREIKWTDTAPSSKYIIKSSSIEGTYEVMGATGLYYEAMEETFNFGRPEDNTVRIYSDWSYESGWEQLRFELFPITANDVTYHLIDIKNNKELLSVVTRQASTADPSFPPDYRSPLVAQYHYWALDNFNVSNGKYTLKPNQTELSTVVTDIYVTYTANNLVDMSGRTMYLLKYALGDQFRQEDGSDGLLAPMSEFTGDDAAKKYKYQAVYPYCNGDCNFFVYGQEQYDSQQQGAASTRTRWAWYVESVDNDPYHVKIRSRQQETYPAGSGNDYNAYFRTYVENYATTDGGVKSNHVVTTLAWPGISGEQGTEYMVLGSAGQFRLVTSDAIDDGSTNVRRAVNSFEQYWKTWNTIRLNVLGDKNAEAKQSDPNTVPATPATKVASDEGEDNRTYLTDVMGWHSYEQWAYAIRWNDYNKAGDKNKKGWEALEHWYQTVNMGEGYFDFVPTTIDPVLILLDQHGWEVMRKPLPSSPDDPDKFAKYDAIRPYDSPMVKEYAFWKTAKKRTGFHQYYLLSDRIGGEDFTSTSLTDLPPYESENVKDAKGNLLDQYVTYIVKDEYAQTYNPSSKTGQPFLIEQGSHFAYNNSNEATVGTKNVPAANEGGMSQYIISNISDLTTTGDKKDELWYVKPNTDIDIEMGYLNETKFPGGYPHSWDSKTPNAYEDSKYSTLKAAVYVKETEEYKGETADNKKKLTDKYGEFSFSNGFDPYNIQISSVSNVEKFFVTNATTAHVHEGSIFGNGTSNTLGAQATNEATLVGGWDNRTIQMTNATFMAVLDEDGSMQLMPRFDQEKRLKDFSTLVHTDDPEEAGTHTKLYRPLVYNYHIIDNSGSEALRYQGGGDLVPQTPEWFQSQLAKDYKYYAGISGSTGENEITESLEGASLTDKNVYVRYSYDETADYNKILQGKWLTMTVNSLDAQYTTVSETAGIYSGTKPDPVNENQWQWKFTANSQTAPDPYAVSLYNRSTAGTETEVNSNNKFVLLNWYDGNGVDPGAYTLAVHGTGTSNYDFVNGTSMNASIAATTATESGVKSTSCTYTAGAKIELNDDVSHTYTYKVYTNGNNGNNAVKYGVFAVSAEQDNITIAENDYVPILPEEIRSPLLNIDQFKYYGAEADMGDATKELKNIFGLYEDNIYVRYTDYDLKATEYKVPNVKTVVDGKVARGEESNDAALDINKELIYNIIWYNDNMMKAVDTTVPADGIYDGISSEMNHALDGNAAYVWQFEGNDPYAIKIKHKNANKYVKQDTEDADSDSDTNECMLNGAATTFMLLPSTDADWQYGVLAKTGDSRYQLSGSGNTLADTQATPTPETPTKFIIFGLSTHKVIYHLVIAKTCPDKKAASLPTDQYVDIPYRKTKGGTETTKRIYGSTQRDLTSKKDDDDSKPAGSKYQLGETKTTRNLTYCVDAGHITLGDPLKVPEELERPNCKYFYYVEGVYTNEDCDRSTHVATELDGQYRGFQITEMGTEPALLGKTVLINVEYQFNDGLPTNNGSDFVTDPSQKKWFTWETSDDKLSQYTGAAGFKMLEGHESHYTNDFLWSPVGDPYGFKMYNRYEYKTNGQTTHVMTTEADPADDGALKLGTDDNKAVYELFAGDTDGYFFVRPMLNNDVAIYNDGGTMKLSATNATEYTFGLSLELLKPYYDRAGYVGGLTPDGKTAYENANGNLQTIQGVVYNDEYIVKFTPGYYRLHSQPDIKDLPQRYLSGYTHKTELDGSIPMHFYEKKGSKPTTFEALGATGYTKTAATQGQLPIVAPEYDPASIFYITGSASAANMSTQGLNVIENHMGTETATDFTLMDIGGAVLLIHDNATPASRQYLCFDQSDAAKIYDIQWKNDTPTDYAKWCLEPANNMGLYIETHSGGEEETLTDLWYYSSYCVPFDLLIADKDGDDKDHSSNAYTCVSTESPWPGTTEAARVGLHPKPIGKYNTEANGCPPTYRGSDYFVPAGTPVLFSTKRATEYIKATIPATSPSSSISTIFSAKYLEQLLTGWDNDKRVYVFGPKMQGTISIKESDGSITAVLPSLGNTSVGFHLNANPNKEAGTTPASWTRHNYYVLHNRIYYKADGGGVSLAPTKRAPEFVPVIFDDDEEEQQELNPNGTMEVVGDGCIYDLIGRKVATREQVEDGSWWNQATPGVYILNGRKVIKK